jgi:hypothetical protein
MNFNPQNNALSMTGLLPSTQVQENLNDQVVENTANIATLELEMNNVELEIASLIITNTTNTTKIADLEIDVATLTTQMNTNTNNISTNSTSITNNTTAINNNTSAITNNTSAIATINYDISEIPVLLAITDINTHGDQYGENGEIYSTNKFDTIDYSKTQINLPAILYFFTTSFPNGGSLKIYTLQTPSTNNQIITYRFQIPVCVKANGTCSTAVNNVNLFYNVPTQYYVIKNGDVFNPIVGSITSHMGGANSPKSFDTITTGNWSFEIYLYTLFIEFSPSGANPNDIFEVYIDITFNCYSFGTANPQRTCVLTQAGYNLNTSLKSPYYTYTNLNPTNVIAETPFCVQGFNSVVLNPQIAQIAINTTNIATNTTDIANLENYVYNILTPAITELQTNFVNFVNNQLYIMPCLYPKDANVSQSVLYVQQYLNVATFDPMPTFTCPYVFSYNCFVMCCDNTSFNPQYCRISIEVSSITAGTTYIWSYTERTFPPLFGFNNQAVILTNDPVSWSSVPIGSQLQFSIKFWGSVGTGNPLVFPCEYVIYPYCNRRPFYSP